MNVQVFYGFLVVLAVLASLWFRRRPMSGSQRKLAVAIAMVLMCAAFLREGHLNVSNISFVVGSAVVLIVALVYLERHNGTPD